MTLKLAPGDTVTLEYEVSRIGQDCVMLRPKGGQYDLSMDYERVKSSLVSHTAPVRVGSKFIGKATRDVYEVLCLSEGVAFIKRPGSSAAVQKVSSLLDERYYERA